MARNKRQVPLAHPGEILNEEFLKPLGMTINALALALRVPSNRLYAIVEASAASVLIRRCGWAATSQPAPSSGSIFRHITTLKP
jgi:hypothetical protein